MKDARAPRRFRTNPVEIVIFSIVSLVFCNSVYNLFNDRQSLQNGVLTPMAANPISENRNPASATHDAAMGMASLNVKCEVNHEQESGASKIRLMGPICGMGENAKFVKTTVTNTADKYVATVFDDVSAGTFSTDYIPLNADKNPVRIEFVFSGGKTVAQDLIINKKK